MDRIVVLLLCYQVLAQPVENVPSARNARELIECCPCPGTSARDGQDWLVDSSQLARAGGVDDCPCRVRGADSEGASSLFFPAALRPDGSQLRPSDPKEDPKNLLEPEVALATSVLDTLREVTDEQYRDALEREAARSAAELDAVPEESARNVVIVLNPKDSDEDDDFVSEASHVKESRCIHPLESLPLGSVKSSANPINILPESFKLPKLKHPGVPRRNFLPFDSNIDASNVKESIVDPHGMFPTFSPKRNKIPFKGILENHNDRFRFGKPDLKLGKFDEKESDHGFKLSLVPKLKSHTNIGDDNVRSASSNIQHQSEPVIDETSQLFQNNKHPLSLRNLLKLRDVELIPKSVQNKSWAKSKLDISKFAIPSLFKSDQSKNLALGSLNKDSKQRVSDEVNDNIFDSDALQSNGVNLMHELSGPFDDLKADSMLNKNISDDDESQTMEDLIKLDALPSPSQIKSSIIRADQEKDSEAIVLPQSISDCDSLDSTGSAINTQLKEALGESHDFDSDLSTFENTDVATENMSNLSDNTEASDFIQAQDQDSDTDSSNIFFSTLVPLESQEKTIEEPTESQRNIESNSEFIEADGQRVPEFFAKTLESENIVPHIKAIPSLGDTLSNLRENVVKPFRNLKNPSIKSELFRTLDDNDNFNVNEGEKTIRGDINLITTKLDPANTANRETIENVSGISMNDLQNMSDQLLDLNINSQNNDHFVDFTASNTPDQTNFKSSDISDKSDSELSETKLNPIEIEREVNVEENACLTTSESKSADMGENSTTKSATPDIKQKEMDTGASDTVINTLPGILDSLNSNLKLRSPLLSEISNPLNLLGKPLGDVLNLNPNLPTLDDLQERLANIFSPDDRSIENDSSSHETDFTNISSVEPMAPEASTRNSQKELPLLKQLKEFNNDIVQKRPKIPNPFDALSKSRTLDLYSYRAHLPSPNSLDLKPLKLEPRVQNRAGKNKPLINFGSDKTVLRKSKPSSTLANPLDGLPTLNELRNTLRSNSKNLLNSPLHSDLLSENVRSHDIEDVAENIRLNTEKTFKGIQRKIKSSLKKPNLHNPLRESLAKPQELLDDVNDKLKGIHYDLNDRLSSLRETFLDSSRINAFADQPRKASNRNVMTNPRNIKIKSSSPRLQTAASTATKHEIDPTQLGLKSRNYVHPDWNVLRKTQTAAESSSVPARVEMPKSVSPPWSHLQRISPPFRQNPIVSEPLRERTPIPSLNRDETPSKDIKGPLFRTAVSPFIRQRQQNKVTITFGPTTARPILPPRPLTRVPNMSTSQFEEFNPSSTSDIFNAFNTDNTAAMSAVPSSKFKPLRTSAPVPSPADEDYEDTLNNFSFEELPSTGSKLKSSVLREMSVPNLPKLHNNSNRLKSANIFDDEMKNRASKTVLMTSHWPKVTENAFLSKVRDAAKNVNVPKPVKDVRSEQLDMLRSPTENTDVVIGEPLKENVSYRCRMVCTKEIK